MNIMYEVIEQSMVNGVLKEYVVDRFSDPKNAHDRVIELNVSGLSILNDWTHYVKQVGIKQ